jgi:phenylpyruvate tautomerase PptA (4-oxalocrotonate tautomerase family)
VTWFTSELVAVAKAAALVAQQSAALVAQLVQLAVESEEPPRSKVVPVSSVALKDYGLGVSCVRAAIRAGELVAVKGSRNRRLVKEVDLLAWRDSRPIYSPRPGDSKTVPSNADPLDRFLSAKRTTKRERASQ